MQSSTASKTQGLRIPFLDSLRAIAVLLVVWGHVMLVGINDANTVHHWLPMVSEPIFGADSVTTNPHGRLGLIVALATGVNPGGLGVALFFLISGFVIVRSVERVTAWQFMIQRFFRIVPTCVAAVLLVATVTWLACRFMGLEQPNNLSSLLTSSFAMNFYNGAFSTIPVLWTLEVEMTFYLLVAALASFPNGLKPASLFATSAACLMFVAVCASPLALALTPTWARLLQHWSSIVVHMSFMLVGALIYKAYISDARLKLATLAALSFALYWLGLNILLSANSQSGIGASSHDALAALAIFLVGMLAGMRAGWLSPLRWVGDISYPMYLLHVPLAWLALYGLSKFGLGLNSAGLASLIMVTLLSWAMHHLVEMPSQRLGKRLAKRSAPQPEPGTRSAVNSKI